jgi:hypothetical protein
MLFQDAGVHHDEETGGARALRRRFVRHAFLPPNGASADAYGGIHDGRHKF